MDKTKKLPSQIGKEEKVIELVKNMLNENMEMNFIAKLTGLTIDRISEIKLEK